MKRFLFILFVITLAGCAHVPKPDEVPYETGADEIIVLAQKEFDKNNYRGAKAYYQIMIDRFAADANIMNIGEYEIAHILIKQKQYQKAADLLQRVLDRFEGSGSALLQPEYKKLAEKDLARIQPKLKHTDEIPDTSETEKNN